MLEASRWTGRHRRWPSSPGHPRPHTGPWAEPPPPASCAPQTSTAQAVVIRSPRAPHDAVGGTGDGLGPTRRSGWDPTGTPPPSGKAHTSPPGPPTRPWAAPPWASCSPQTPTALAVIVRSSLAPNDAVGGTAHGLGPSPNSDSDPVDVPQPSPTAPTGLPRLQARPMSVYRGFTSSYPCNAILPRACVYIVCSH